MLKTINIIVVEDYGVDKMDYKKIQLPVESLDYPIAVCLGNFDGIHKGHQKLIEKTVEVAKKENIASAFFTFSPNPRKFFSKDRVYQLTSIDDRKEIVSKYDIDLLDPSVFDDGMEKMLYFLNKYNMKYIIVDTEGKSIEEVYKEIDKIMDGISNES